MSEIYRLTLRSDPSYSESLPRDELAGRLAKIPGLRDEGGGIYRFGEPDVYGVMEIELARRHEGVLSRGATQDEAGLYNVIEVRVPRHWVMEKGPQVFALVFMMAAWNRWVVYDEQIQDTLQKEAVLQGLVAMRQAKLDAERKETNAGNDDDQNAS